MGNHLYNRDLERSVGAGCPVCEVCKPCGKITAENIYKDDVNLTKFNTATRFILPDVENLEVKIGKDMWTKSELLEIKEPIKL